MTQPQVRLLILIFVFSGAAGLVYEVVWARQLVLVFGNTTQAVSAILTGFFGGLAIGSVLGGRLADRLTRPLRLYGLLELALVGIVLATPVTFDLIHEAYRGFYQGLADVPIALALTRFTLAILALAPATILMGATLPTLTRYLTERSNLGRAFGQLYAANTIGAIAGTAAAGFVLIELLGLTGALLLGAAASGTAGLVALALDRQVGPAARPADPGRSLTTRATGGSSTPTLRLAYVLAFVSGLTSVGYQVVWNRLLALGTGNSTYVFTVILTLFLLGIAIGAVLLDRIRHRIDSTIGLIAVAQALTALCVLVGSTFILSRPAIPLIYAVGGEFFGNLATFAVAAALVVLPATVAMGITFPATADLLGGERGHEGRAAGTLLALNTLGAIVATFVLPFFVFPVVGSPATLAGLVLVNAVVAIWLAFRADVTSGLRRRARTIGMAVLVVAVGLQATGIGFRNPTAVAILVNSGVVFEEREDEIAPVQAARLASTPQLFVTGTSMTLITVDTKFMPLLPLALRPQARRLLVVAFGMGTAYRTGLKAGLEVDAVELVPSVPKMFKWFYQDAQQYLDHPRGKVIVADGRNHVELSDTIYDLIVVDPPPPIETSGVSVISTLEFYEAAKRRLTPDGVMMQWVPYGQTLDEYLAHVRSFSRAFANVRVIFGPGGYGTYMLGSDGSVALTEAALANVLARPGILEDVNGAPDAGGRTSSEWTRLLMGNTWLTEDEVETVVRDGALVTDDRPYPEYFLIRRIADPDAVLMNPGSMIRLRQEAIGR